MTMRDMRIGLIGAGFMGRAHSAAYATMQMHVWPPCATPRLVAIADENAALAKTGAERFGYSSWTQDWRELIARPDIDIVDVCTPPDSHREIALEAIRHRKHVLVEKPIAMNSREALEMLQAAEAAGVKHLVGFSYRRTPAVLYARRLLDEGALGKLYSFRGQYLQDWCVDENAPRTWRHVAAVAGSGALGDIGTHIIDIARMMMGEVEAVVSMMKTWVHERPLDDSPGAARGPVTVDDEAMFLARFASGALGRIETTRFAHGRKNFLGFEINGERGSIVFDYEDMTKLGLYLADGPEAERGFRLIQTGPAHPYGRFLWPIPALGIGFTETKIIEVADFFELIVDDRPVSPNFYDGYRISQIVEAVQELDRSKGWATVGGSDA